MIKVITRMIKQLLILSLLLIQINLTFGKFHCSTFPENNNGVIMTSALDLSFFIYCHAGSNDNTYNEYELKLRHFDRSNGELFLYVYTTRNEIQVIDLYDENGGYHTRFYFNIDDKVTSERRGFKISAVPQNNHYLATSYINDTISLDIITFGDHQTSTEVHYYLSYS